MKVEGGEREKRGEGEVDGRDLSRIRKCESRESERDGGGFRPARDSAFELKKEISMDSSFLFV